MIGDNHVLQPEAISFAVFWRTFALKESLCKYRLTQRLGHRSFSALMPFSINSIRNCNSSMDGKIAFLKAIQREKEILFECFSNSVSAKLKEDKWEAIRQELLDGGFKLGEKPWKALRDLGWQHYRRIAVEKRERMKISGASGAGKYNEVGELGLPIPEKESAAVKGLGVTEMWQEPSMSQDSEVSDIETVGSPNLQIQLLQLQVIEKEIAIYGRQMTPYQHSTGTIWPGYSDVNREEIFDEADEENEVDGKKH
ncbi:hypothetical protein L596_018217 [Steinernema carpocapsae]|uniref:Regulatory protein zeste n=1 Tax=Steinernema carpocapsae TaxID=34508 RepID=A0A4U5N4R4_STECR|nr:hypothetical protein L596_018217 [Steinernema carpocapsae]